jgi:hypothetical protein
LKKTPSANQSQAKEKSTPSLKQLAQRLMNTLYTTRPLATERKERKVEVRKDTRVHCRIGSRRKEEERCKGDDEGEWELRDDE